MLSGLTELMLAASLVDSIVMQIETPCFPTSLMNNRNRRGPGTVPRGTPDESGTSGELFRQTTAHSAFVASVCEPCGSPRNGWGGGREVLPFMGYIGMCGAKGYGFFSRFGLK